MCIYIYIYICGNFSFVPQPKTPRRKRRCSKINKGRRRQKLQGIQNYIRTEILAICGLPNCRNTRKAYKQEEQPRKTQKTSKNKENAIYLLEYLSSDRAQNFYASANKEYPVLIGAKVHESIQEWGDFNEDNINVSKLGSLQKQAVLLAQEVGYK